MNNILISVIIPVYNSEKYLKQCLDSVINQTYNNLEIIVVNDGSTDKSLEIIKSYKDSRIKLINKENGGVSSARNVGLKEATGEYIMFVDSDDYLTNNNVIEELIDSTNNGDIVRYNYLTLNNGQLIKDNFVDSLNNTYESGEFFLLDVLNKKKDYGWFLWQYMFKRSLWEGIVFPNRVIFEDLSTIFKVILKANKVSVINNNIYTYRENNLSVTKNVTYNKCLQLIDSMKDSIEYVNKIDINNELKVLLNNNFSYGYVSEMLLVDYLNKEEKKEINRLLIKNKDISNNIIYGKQKLLLKLSNIFGINFVELILSIRNKIK